MKKVVHEVFAGNGLPPVDITELTAWLIATKRKVMVGGFTVENVRMMLSSHEFDKDKKTRILKLVELAIEKRELPPIIVSAPKLFDNTYQSIKVIDGWHRLALAYFTILATGEEVIPMRMWWVLESELANFKTTAFGVMFNRELMPNETM